MLLLRLLTTSMLALPAAAGSATHACSSTPCPAPALPTWEFHGEVRSRASRMDPNRFGIGTNADADSLGLGRFLGSVLWRGDHWRAFVQLGAHVERGREGGPVRTDQSAVDAQQAWLGWQSNGWSAWAGRQELAFGTGRLLSKRDGPNIRLAFDGLRASRQTAHGRIDAFLARPVLNTPGAFDDRSDHTQLLWGLYSTQAAPALDSKWDAYLLGYRREHARFAIGTGDESRRTVGVRLFGTRAAWDWNLEAMAQWGQFQPVVGASQDVRAWRAAGEGGYTFADAAGSPRLSLRFDVASGDARPHDGRLGTFNALYAVPTFVETSLVAPANVVDVQPALTIHPREGTELTFGWHAAWKHERADAVYTVPMPLTPVPGTAGTHRRIGDQFKLEAHQQLTTHWSMLLVLGHMRAGPALREAGGTDTNYTDAMLEWHW